MPQGNMRRPLPPRRPQYSSHRPVPVHLLHRTPSLRDPRSRHTAPWTAARRVRPLSSRQSPQLKVTARTPSRSQHQRLPLRKVTARTPSRSQHHRLPLVLLLLLLMLLQAPDLTWHHHQLQQNSSKLHPPQQRSSRARRLRIMRLRMRLRAQCPALQVMWVHSPKLRVDNLLLLIVLEVWGGCWERCRARHFCLCQTDGKRESMNRADTTSPITTRSRRNGKIPAPPNPRSLLVSKPPALTLPSQVLAALAMGAYR